MDITKSIVGTLDEENIPIELSAPSDSGKYIVLVECINLSMTHFLEEKQVIKSKPAIKSVSNCLDILAQCHKSIKARDDSRLVFPSK